jgi:RHS repeat-associated protein
LVKVSSSVSTTEYTSFDILGRVTGHKQTTDGGDSAGYSTSYTYNLGGAMIEETYPSTRVVRNELNSNGELANVKSKKVAASPYWTYANNFTYNPAGAVTSMELGNLNWESSTFNTRLQPTQIALGKTASATDLLKLDYGYGTTANNGNVASQTITVKRSGQSDLVFDQTYTFDSLNRIHIAEEKTGSTTNWKQTFIFDRYGNRNFDRNNTTQPASFSNPSVSDPTVNTVNNRFASGQGWVYDAAGNVITDAEGRTFTYDAENKQKEVKNSSAATLGTYYFDGDGKRVKKFVPGTGETTIFVYDAGGKMVAEYSTNLSSTPQVQYLTNDYLGTPRIITNALGTINARTDYMPYGEEIIALGGRSSTDKYVADDVRQGFTGYERDSEINLDFAQARFNNFAIGRFNSPDPYNVVMTIQYEQDRRKADEILGNYLLEPQQWNRYVYVMNNPLIFTDPTGEVIYLTGSADEQRAALERLKSMLGPERAKLLDVATMCISEQEGNITVVSITESNSNRMAGIGTGDDEAGFSVRMSEILVSKEAVEYRLATNFTTNDGRNHTVAEFGGAATVDKTESTTGRVQIFVHPGKAVDLAESRLSSVLGRNKSSDGGALYFTNEIIDAHEFGHAHEGMFGGSVNSEPAGWKAVRMENYMRNRQNGIVGPRRRRID